jgi:hypothetical protein
LGESLRQFVAGIGTIGEEVAQPGEEIVNGFDDERGAIAVLNIGGVNLGADEEANRIGDDGVESRRGVSPPRAPRTVREPLGSYGSRCSSVDIQ